MLEVGEMNMVQLEMVFLSISITTFYRKSFSFKSQGHLVLISLINYLSVSHNSPALVQLAAAGVLALVLADRLGSYDVQDLVNNIIMIICLTWINNSRPSQFHLWLSILCLSPAQLMRYQGKRFMFLHKQTLACNAC